MFLKPIDRILITDWQFFLSQNNEDEGLNYRTVVVCLRQPMQFLSTYFYIHLDIWPLTTRTYTYRQPEHIEEPVVGCCRHRGIQISQIDWTVCSSALIYTPNLSTYELLIYNPH